MKKKLILGLSLLCLMACANNVSSTAQPTTTATPTTVAPTTTIAPTTTATPTTVAPTTTIAPTTTAKPTTTVAPTTTATPTTQTPTTVPPTTVPTTQTPTTVAPLTMSLLIDGVQKEDKTYEMYVYGTMQITPLFNDQSRAETVTYKATESSIFGSSTSYNVTIDANGLLKATGKASAVTVTVTSSSGLTDSFTLKIIAKADAHYSNIVSKLDGAIAIENSSSIGGTFKKATATSETVSSYTISDNGSMKTTTTTDSVTTNTYSILHEDKYYTVNTDASDVVTSSSKSDTKPSSFGKYVAKLSSFVSCNGLSETAKYVLSNSSYFNQTSVYNHADISFDEANEKYVISSEYYVNDTFAGKSYNVYELVFDFEGDKLTSFKYDYKQYGSDSLDGEKLNSNPVAKSITLIEGTLSYGERTAFDAFDLSTLFVSSYDVTLKDANGVSGNEFAVGSELSFEYNNVQPSTANALIDPLNFKSSSDTSVANINANNKIECLKAGSTTLTFVSDSGVEKTVELTVKFDGIEGVAFSSELTSVETIKVGQTVTFTAHTVPNIENQAISVSIKSGSEFATLTNNSGSYTLTAIAGGTVTIEASTEFNGQTFTCEHTITIKETMKTEDVIELFANYVFEDKNAFTGKPNNKIAFNEGKGVYTSIGSSYDITFDYEVSGSTITISNVVSGHSSFTLTKVELADDGSSITVTIKNTLFGSSSTYTMNKVKRPIEILDEDPDADMEWGSLS